MSAPYSNGFRFQGDSGGISLLPDFCVRGAGPAHRSQAEQIAISAVRNISATVPFLASAPQQAIYAVCPLALEPAVRLYVDFEAGGHRYQ